MEFPTRPRRGIRPQVTTAYWPNNNVLKTILSQYSLVVVTLSAGVPPVPVLGLPVQPVEVPGQVRQYTGDHCHLPPMGYATFHLSA